MTLKELIKGHTFDEIEPVILKLYPEQKDALIRYKQLFDWMQITNPIPIEGGLDILKIGWIEDEYGGWISVMGDGGGCDASTLSQEVVIEDTLQLSPPEIIAHIMWELTFYGFTPEQRREKFDYILSIPQNKYGELARQQDYRYYRA